MKHRRQKLFQFWRAFACAFALLLAGGARADEAAEQKVKAAFIPHLAALVTWPEATFTNATEPIRLGILGDFPLGQDFEPALLNQSAQGRKFTITHYREIKTTLNCHILLVGSPATEKLPTLLAALAHRPILTIGDTPGFAAAGGIINFIREDSKVRFEINPAAAAQARLTLNARLLQVARLIQP
ncbi:MAG: hypothetical protein RL380_176 [Verrucomicrobiota bacterium]|jgi:hypothetical protein